MSGVIITITGPSCAGKTHLEAQLLKEPGFARIVSHTTRPMREGEVNGREYHFTDKSQFKRLRDQGFFAETAMFAGNYYGGEARQFQGILNLGKNVVVVCEPNGREQIIAFAERKGLRLLPVFVTNPTDVIADRFIQRLLGEWSLKIGKGGEALSDVMHSYTQRLDAMLSEEREWAQTDYPFSLTFGKYGPDNDRLVVDRIIAAADAVPAAGLVEVD
jgi:guanylate kinase